MDREASILRRVLLVNDSPDEQEMYARWLDLHGCNTLHAECADEAYRMALELAPDIVVTDVNLRGDDDGLALTRRLKHDEHTRRLPVVVLSGYVFQRDDDAALQAGCDLVVHKPCLPTELVTALDGLKSVGPRLG